MYLSEEGHSLVLVKKIEVNMLNIYATLASFIDHFTSTSSVWHTSILSENLQAGKPPSSVSKRLLKTMGGGDMSEPTNNAARQADERPPQHTHIQRIPNLLHSQFAFLFLTL